MYNSLAKLGGFLFMVGLLFVLLVFVATILMNMWKERYDFEEDETDDGFWEGP